MSNISSAVWQNAKRAFLQRWNSELNLTTLATNLTKLNVNTSQTGNEDTPNGGKGVIDGNNKPNRRNKGKGVIEGNNRPTRGNKGKGVIEGNNRPTKGNGGNTKVSNRHTIGNGGNKKVNNRPIVGKRRKPGRPTNKSKNIKRSKKPKSHTVLVMQSFAPSEADDASVNSSEADDDAQSGTNETNPSPIKGKSRFEIVIDAKAVIMQEKILNLLQSSQIDFLNYKKLQLLRNFTNHSFAQVVADVENNDDNTTLSLPDLLNQMVHYEIQTCKEIIEGQMEVIDCTSISNNCRVVHWFTVYTEVELDHILMNHLPKASPRYTFHDYTTICHTPASCKTFFEEYTPVNTYLQTELKKPYRYHRVIEVQTSEKCNIDVQDFVTSALNGSEPPKHRADDGIHLFYVTKNSIDLKFSNVATAPFRNPVPRFTITSKKFTTIAKSYEESITKVKMNDLIFFGKKQVVDQTQKCTMMIESSSAKFLYVFVATKKN